MADGSTIVIPNDPTNSGRALLLLQSTGLLQLKDSVGLLPTVNDIVSNPKKIKILELDAPQLPRALDDQTFSIAIINNTFASAAGLVARRGHQGLVEEGAQALSVCSNRNAPSANSGAPYLIHSSLKVTWG